MHSVSSKSQPSETQDVVTPQQIWLSRWVGPNGAFYWEYFGTQAEAINHLRANISPPNRCITRYLGTLWASATVDGGINQGEIDLRSFL